MSALVPVVTATLGVKPEIAKQVVRGLTPPKPIYERVGGTIRRIDNKQIVTWLRNADAPIADWAALSKLGPLMQLSAATSLLNLSVSSVGFVMVMRRLATIESKLDTTLEAIQKTNRKLDLTFYANFRAALELARGAFIMQDERNRRTSATHAINRFLEAEHHYLGLLDMELEAGSLAVSPFLNTLILAYVTVARCYLELEEIETARRHLQEGRQTLSSRTEQFYTSTIGVNPAIYLHPDLANEISLERVTHLLRYEDPTLTEAAVFEALRPSIWETASQNPDPWLKKLPESLWRHGVDGKGKLGPIKQSCGKKEKFKRLLPRLPEAFTQVEQAVEAAGCVDGFQIELDYLLEHNVSFTDWQQLELPSTSQDDPIVLVIPKESELLLAED